MHVKILRYSPEGGEKKIDTFRVPHQPGMTVQTLCRYIYENVDSTLAYRDFRCGYGICNTCRIKLNGRAVRACETLINPDEEVLLEPANERIIKDLVAKPN